MSNLNFKWVENKGRFQSGESLYLNRINIGSYGWNSGRVKSDGLGDSIDWAGELSLPSLGEKAKRVFGSNPDEVKAEVERVVISWFKEALKEGGT